MAQLVELTNQVPEVVGLIPTHYTFSPEKQITEIFRYHSIAHRKCPGKWR